MSAPRDPKRALAFIALASVLLSGLSASVKAATPHAGLAASIFARGICGIVACGLWAAWRRETLRPRGWGHLSLRCTAGGAAMVCYYSAIGYRDVELGTAAMLLKTSPLWVALGAPFLVGERPGSRTWAGLALGLLGVGCAYGFVPQGERIGLLLCVVGGVLAALAYLSLRGLARSDGPATIVFAFSVFLAAGSLPFLPPWTEARAWSPQLWALLTWIGLCGVGGQLALTAAYRYGSAAAVTVAGLMEVALATGLSLLLFSQQPKPAAIVGGALALTGALWASREDRPAEAS